MALHGNGTLFMEDYIRNGSEENLVKAWTMLIAPQIEDISVYPFMAYPGMFCDAAKKLISATSATSPHLLIPMLERLLRENAEARPFTNPMKSEEWVVVSDEVCHTAFKALLSYKEPERFVNAFARTASFLQLALKNHCFARNYSSYQLLLKELGSRLLNEQVTKEELETMSMRLGNLMSFKYPDTTQDDLKTRAYSLLGWIQDLEKASHKELSVKVKAAANLMKVFDSLS